jgi:hypothetical protein
MFCEERIKTWNSAYFCLSALQRQSDTAWCNTTWLAAFSNFPGAPVTFVSRLLCSTVLTKTCSQSADEPSLSCEWYKRDLPRLRRGRKKMHLKIVFGYLATFYRVYSYRTFVNDEWRRWRRCWIILRYCHVYEWLSTGFRLGIGFIDHLQVVTTTNLTLSLIAHFTNHKHTLSLLLHAVPSPAVAW